MKNKMSEHLSHLAALIADNHTRIIEDWKAAACKLPHAQNLDEPLLLDHMPQLLHELSSALTQAHSIPIVQMKSAEQHGALLIKSLVPKDSRLRQRAKCWIFFAAMRPGLASALCRSLMKRAICER
jgi:hypothetical protein